VVDGPEHPLIPSLQQLTRRLEAATTSSRPFLLSDEDRGRNATVHIDLYVALAGLIVGFVVGMTGMGGGALMTPILVLIFKFSAPTAVASDLVAAMVMKPIGGGVHTRSGTVRWELVRWLAIGSVPAAFSGVLVTRLLGNSDAVANRLKIILGVVLLSAASLMMLRAYLQGRQTRRDKEILRRTGALPEAQPLVVKKVPTILIGAVGGLVVGMTSVGSGSLIIIALMTLYPMLRGNELVGTDLVQAVPLVAAAAVGQILFGQFQLGLSASILIGSIPGVFVGAKLSSKAPNGIIRPALVFVLLASGLKLVNVGTTQLAIVLGLFALLALPVWGAIDAAGRPEPHFAAAGLSKRPWVLLQAAGALFGLGFGAALAYFASARPKLVAVESVSEPVG